jgi:hypothetical protein
VLTTAVSSNFAASLEFLKKKKLYLSAVIDNRLPIFLVDSNMSKFWTCASRVHLLCSPYFFLIPCLKVFAHRHGMQGPKKYFFIFYFLFFPEIAFFVSLRHRLKMELDLQSLFRLYVHSYTYWLRPRNPPPPPPEFGGSYTRALLVI